MRTMPGRLSCQLLTERVVPVHDPAEQEGYCVCCTRAQRLDCEGNCLHCRCVHYCVFVCFAFASQDLLACSDTPQLHAKAAAVPKAGPSCTSCNAHLNEGESLVTCASCENAFHPACASSVTEDEAGNPFQCGSCRCESVLCTHSCRSLLRHHVFMCTCRAGASATAKRRKTRRADSLTPLPSAPASAEEGVAAPTPRFKKPAKPIVASPVADLLHVAATGWDAPGPRATARVSLYLEGLLAAACVAVFPAATLLEIVDAHCKQRNTIVVPRTLMDSAYESQPVPSSSHKRARSPSRRPRARSTSSELHCVCQRPEDPDSTYVLCDGCSCWFHPSCLGVDEDEVCACS